MRQRLGAALLGVLCACGGSLRVNMIDATHRPPSNVAVYLAVDTRDGAAVGSLTATDFEISEDGALISTGDSKQALLKPEVAAAHYTLLLLDMSGSVEGADQTVMITEAARQFVSELSSQQHVAIYAFDGASELHRIQSFSPARAAARSLERLKRFRTQNPSTNLHGAVRDALQTLDKALDQTKQTLRFGSVVVFTLGTDRAAQVSAAQLDQTIAASELDLFAIGMGNQIDEGTLSRVGVNGYVRVADARSLAPAFRAVGDRIAAFTRRYYLLSYCSLARTGAHEVTIRAIDPQGGAKGRVRFTLDASGFNKRACNPDRPPPFPNSKKKRGTVGRGTAPRGLRLQVASPAPSGDPTLDPELGDVTVNAADAQAAPPADPNTPPPLDMEALDNELPPGLKSDDETEEED